VTDADVLRRAGDASVLILTSLADGPKHGYAIMADVAAFSGVSMEPGTLYGALSRLERRGWVRPLAAEERRRPYEITAAGQEILAEQVTTMQQIVRVARLRAATAWVDAIGDARALGLTEETIHHRFHGVVPGWTTLTCKGLSSVSPIVCTDGSSH
jgi:DNA-binding PadR family transcriptional regulator